MMAPVMYQTSVMVVCCGSQKLEGGKWGGGRGGGAGEKIMMMSKIWHCVREAVIMLQKTFRQNSRQCKTQMFLTTDFRLSFSASFFFLSFFFFFFFLK